MIYTLENHELKHAVEEMLFHLLPTETLTRVETVEQRTEPYCRSILTEENGEAAARAIVCMDGAVHEAEKRASVTGLATRQILLQRRIRNTLPGSRSATARIRRMSPAKCFRPANAMPRNTR